MKVTIVAEDNLVLIDGRAVKVMGMVLLPELPEIHAVQYDTDTGRGELEYKTVDIDGDGPIPSYKPQNDRIDAAQFQAWYSVILEQAKAALVEADAQEAEQVILRAKMLASEDQVKAAAASEVEDLKAMLATLAETVKAQDTLLKNMLTEAAKVASAT